MSSNNPVAQPAVSATLDVLTMPLQGLQVIEASAGTGKTWTLAALYVRLVLGHGGAGGAAGSGDDRDEYGGSRNGYRAGARRGG